MIKDLKTSYIPAFDGIRGISILIVFIGHLGFEHIIPGGLGVTIFFFISGFLITRLLIQEYERTSTIGLKDFFIRRLLRLYPPLLFFILLLSGLLLAIESNINLIELSAALFYYENYYVVFSEDLPKRFQILWSLAIEEHFYLVFPFIFLALFSRQKTFLIFTLLLALAALLSRIYVATKFNANDYADYYTYTLTHCRADSIMFGCVLSLLIHADKAQRFLNFSESFLVFAGAVILLLLSLVYRDEFFRQTYRYTLQGISLLLLLPPILYSTKFVVLNKLLSIKPLIFIGKLSYSIYLFHWVGLYMGYNFSTKGTINWYLINLIVTFILAPISFYFVEKKVAGLRKRFGSNIK